MPDAKLLIGGSWLDGDERRELLDAFSGAVVGQIHCASTAQVRSAVDGLVAAHASGPLAPPTRQAVLAAASRQVAARRDELVEAMATEAGFTRSDATGEIDRAVETLRLSGEEAVRLAGDVVPLDGAPGGQGRMGFTLRVPVGVVCAITPFNSPLNTVAHKVAPALASGNAVLLKPSLRTPVTAELLVRILLDSGLPEDRIALVHGPGETVGADLLADQRIAFYTFTGSTTVGRAIQRAAGLRRTQLELGGLSSTIICADADLTTAVAKSVLAAFRKAGQVCTSTQRLYVHSSVLDQVTDDVCRQASALRSGDPRDPRTVVGPLISREAARRVERWVDDARLGGASVLVGGGRDGSVVDPTVLAGVAPSMRVMCEEVFGPVLVLRPFDDLEDVVEEVNATPFGLAAGLFTKDIATAMHLAHRLHMGSVHVNETSSSRLDLMPSGGVKDSGFGKEGPRYAAREMTEERLVSVRYG